MPKSYEDFLKEAKKWYSSHNEFEEETNNNNNSYRSYYDDDDVGPDYDDYEPDYYEGDGEDDDYGYDNDEEFDWDLAGFKPRLDFDKDDVVIYKGNTGGRHGQKGKVHRIREDGKIVLRFDVDNKLIAVNKDRVFHEADDIEIKRLEEEWKAKKEIERQQKEKERKERMANQKQNPTEPYKPGEKWWEKNKKEE